MIAKYKLLSAYQIDDDKRLREIIKRQVIKGDIISVQQRMGCVMNRKWQSPTFYDIIIRGENGR